MPPEYSSDKDVYEVERQLGQGVSGTTYLARGQRSGEHYVLKNLHMAKAADWKSVELFEREVDVLEQLNHAQIPNYVDYIVADEGKVHVLVQEYLRGQTLRTLIEGSQPVAVEKYEDLLRQGLEILEYLHGLVPPVIHRDITPNNLIVDGGKIYLVDFGAVKTAVMHSSYSMTSVGTFGYMPPEQMRGMAEPASDLYALGMSFIALAAHSDPRDIPLHRATGDIDFRGLSFLPKTIVDCLKKMTRLQLNARTQSAREAMDILDGKSAGAEEPLSTATTKQRGEVPLPKGLIVDEQEDRLTLTRKWFSPKFIFITFFALLWNAFMVGWFTISISMGQWEMAAFGSIHACVGLWLIYYVLAGFLNRTTISIDSSALIIRHKPIPYPGNREIPSEQINQLFSKEKISQGKNSTSIAYELHAILRGQEKLKLLSGLDDADQALYLEQEIEKYLGIEDRVVRGELS